MMSGVDLMLELKEREDKLFDAIDDLYKFGRLAPEEDREFKIARQKEMLTQRAKGLPVSILKEVAEGEEGVAELKCKADTTENLFLATKELIQALKLSINTLKEQIAREWAS